MDRHSNNLKSTPYDYSHTLLLQIFSKKIKQYLKDNLISISDFSRATGINESDIKDLLSGRISLTTNFIQQLENIFIISLPIKVNRNKYKSLKDHSYAKSQYFEECSSYDHIFSCILFKLARVK